MPNINRVLSVVTVLLLLSLVGFYAQERTGTLIGTVQDEAGRVDARCVCYGTEHRKGVGWAENLWTPSVCGEGVNR